MTSLRSAKNNLSFDGTAFLWDDCVLILQIFFVIITLLQKIAIAGDVSVNFDNYLSSQENDLLTNFTVKDNAFTQSSTGGVSGGCLIPKLSTSWGNTNAESNYRFTSSQGAEMSSSIDFKYDASLVNPNQYERPVGIFLNPSKDWNHYILSYLEKTGESNEFRFAISTYSSSHSSPSITLSNNWYRHTLTVNVIGGFFGDEISVRGEFFDLGKNGTSTPLSLGIIQASIYDTYLSSDSAISITLHGSKWGGAQYLDNFRISGPITDSLPPSIMSHPNDLRVGSGESASFSASADGTSLSYQWYKNGSPISGATASSYTIPNAKASDAGNYTVIVANSAGTVTSNAATLTVVTPPSITSDLSTVSVPKGKLIPRFTITTNFGAKTFAAKGLPRGLKLNAKNGVISGKPTKPGTYTVTLTARKMKGKKVEQQATATKVVIVY
ncbi:MAG: immunoglobulin domain-containing protein [Verrucomicrobia bacterium]|nr:immunoglobulin domain-containing protein [Verrucomicrobiota bacterium]